MANCECIPGCPFYNGRMATDMPHIVESMKRRYCEGSNEACARHMIVRTLGKPHVPADLVPNQVAIAERVLAEKG